jgi:hypothetical protein
MKLKSTLDPLPTGFVYQDYQTKAVITASSFSELLKRVIQHRHLNGLTIHGNQEQMIHDQLCDKLGPAFCEGYGLGDMVHTLAKPIAKAIDSFAGTNVSGCGACAQRRARLNSTQ